MFKRVLVLVLFLFAVFWWLTHRDGETPQLPEKTELTFEETTSEEVDSDSDAEGDKTEDGDESKTEETDAEEAEEVKVTAAVAKPTVAQTVTQTFKPTVTAPVVAPTVTAPRVTPPVQTYTPPAPVVPAPAPVVQEPSVPARTTNVKVYMYDRGVDFSDKTIPAGTINFQVDNSGRFSHDVNISGFGNLGKVAPSETKTFTVKLKAGDYTMFSDRRNDLERGVTDTFTVTP